MSFISKETFKIDEKKLMKSFFNLKQAIAELRELHPDALATTSVQELYDILIEFVEFVVWIRINSDQNLKPYLNPIIKEAKEISFDVPSTGESSTLRWRKTVKSSPVSFEDVSGLIRIRFKPQPYLASAEEIHQLRLLISDLIYIKRRILASETIQKKNLRLNREVSQKREKAKRRFSYLHRKRNKR